MLTSESIMGHGCAHCPEHPAPQLADKTGTFVHPKKNTQDPPEAEINTEKIYQVDKMLTFKSILGVPIHYPEHPAPQ